MAFEGLMGARWGNEFWLVAVFVIHNSCRYFYTYIVHFNDFGNCLNSAMHTLTILRRMLECQLPPMPDTLKVPTDLFIGTRNSMSNV